MFNTLNNGQGLASSLIELLRNPLPESTVPFPSDGDGILALEINIPLLGVNIPLFGVTIPLLGVKIPLLREKPVVNMGLDKVPA